MVNTILDLGVAIHKLTGEAESGDLHLVKEFSNGILIAVIDGLGHGSEAALAAGIAAKVLEAFPDQPVKSLLKRCHESLMRTRGAVMSLASFDPTVGTMTWLGVGNVEGILLYANSGAEPVHKSLLLRHGIVGYRLTQLHEITIPVSRGDTLILATDGINYHFMKKININDPPQQIADMILARHSKGNDDALVLVARYLGGEL